MLKYSYILCVVLLFMGMNSKGQNEEKINSLRSQLQSAANDSVSASVTCQLGREYRKTDPVVAEDYARKSIEFANKANDETLQGNAYQLLGVIKKYQGDLRQALTLYETSRAHFVKAGDKEGEANILNNIGVVHKNLGNLDSALAYYDMAVDLFESIGLEEGVAKTYMNIGVVMKHKAAYDQAVEYYLKSLNIYEQRGNSTSLAKCYNNLGVLYRVQKFLNKALEMYRKSLAIAQQAGSAQEEALTLAHMGAVYCQMDSSELGLEYFEQAKKIFTRLGNKNGIASIAMNEGVELMEKDRLDEALKNFRLAESMYEDMDRTEGVIDCKMLIGEVLSKQGVHKEAIENITESANLAKKIGEQEALISAYNKLAFAYARKGDYKNGFEYYKAFHNLQDSLSTGRSKEKMAELTEMYEHEKKERLIKDAEAKLALAEAENAKKDARQQLMLWISGLIILMFLVATWALIVNRNKSKKLAARNEEISYKNLLIETKNKDILDSIQYAKRLQDAILPTEEMIRDILPDGFVLFKPKDIVSGDFYWVDKVDDKVLFGVFDCTGHGVPGAFMSIIGYNGINQAVNEQGLVSPEKIMDHLNVTVANTLRQSSGSVIKVRDGMDTALCSIDMNALVLKFTGAMNPMYLVREGEIKVFKGDKQPVGAVEAEMQVPYSVHEMAVQKGDCIYLFSDGYVDQFGGNNDKKYKLKRFRQLLLSIWQKPMQEQHHIINETFVNWKGANEQLDDVCVVGIRI